MLLLCSLFSATPAKATATAKNHAVNPKHTQMYFGWNDLQSYRKLFLTEMKNSKAKALIWYIVVYQMSIT